MYYIITSLPYAHHQHPPSRIRSFNFCSVYGSFLFINSILTFHDIHITTTPSFLFTDDAFSFFKTRRWWILRSTPSPRRAPHLLGLPLHRRACRRLSPSTAGRCYCHSGGASRTNRKTHIGFVVVFFVDCLVKFF